MVLIVKGKIIILLNDEYKKWIVNVWQKLFGIFLVLSVYIYIYIYIYI